MLAELSTLLLSGADRGDALCYGYIPDGADEAQGEVGYTDFVDRALRIGRGLRELGAGPGTRVALFAPADVELMTTLAGALLCGATVAPVNHHFRGRELASYLSVIEPTVLLHSPATADVAAGVDSRFPVVRVTTSRPSGADGSAAVTLDELSASEPLDPPPVDPDSAAFIMHTSGTTALPKGVVRTHRTYAEFVQLWARDYMSAADSVLSFMPMYHQGGVMMSFLPAYLRGNPVHQLERFSTETFWAAARRYRTRWAVFMPPVPSFLLLAEPPQDHPFEWAMTGGRVDHWAEMQARFAIPGHSGYGSTETTMVTMTGGRADGPAPADVLQGPRGGFACGRPIPGWNEYRVVRPDGAPAAPLEAGELELRGRGVFGEYFRDPDATARAFTADGWFRPNDIAYVDESGQLFMVDRSRDVIRRSGENISPREIEDVLHDHPGVAEAAVVPVDDELRGQEIRACVVLRVGSTVSAHELFDHCAEHLSAFKVPRYIELCAALVHTPTLKVRKDELIAAADPSRWIDRTRAGDRDNQPIVTQMPDC